MKQANKAVQATSLRALPDLRRSSNLRDGLGLESKLRSLSEIVTMKLS